MKISVVICTYNYFDDLWRAIDSCHIPCIDDVVVVDDGSKNREAFNKVMMQAYGISGGRDQTRPPTRIFRHHKNHGLASARNTGIGNAKNPWILCLDSDDYFDRDGVEALAKEAFGKINTLKNGAIFHGHMKVMNITTKVVRMAVPPQGPITRESLLAGPPCWTTSLFHKEVWNSLAGFKVRAEKSHYDDWNFWIRAWLAGFKFKYVDRLVVTKTERATGICHDLASRQDYFRKLATEDLE